MLFSTILFGHPSFAAWTNPPPTILHLGVLGTYDVDELQFERVGARLSKANPDRKIISLTRDRDSNPFDKSPFELRELGYDLERRLEQMGGYYKMVVIQATAQDFEAFWRSLGTREPWLDVLRGRLAEDATIVFTGAPALGAEVDVGRVEIKAKALFEALGTPRGTLLAAVSPVHVPPTRTKATLKVAAFVAAASSLGTGGTAMSYIPRDVHWVDAAVIGGGLAWAIGDLGLNLVREKIRQRRLPEAERKPRLLASVINTDVWTMGFGLSGIVVGLMYSGPAILDQTFAIYSVGFTAAAAAGLLFLKGREGLAAYLRPNSVNRGRLITLDAEGALVADDLSTEDARAYTCEDVFVTSGRGARRR